MIRRLLLILIPVIVSGCAGNVRPTGYLEDYGQLRETDTRKVMLSLKEEQDDSIDDYFLTRADLRRLEKNDKQVPDALADGVDLEAAQPVLFIVEKPEWRATTRLEREEEGKILFTVRERFYRYLLRQYPHPVRVRYAWLPEDTLTEGYRVVTLETAVTDIKKGNGLLRYIIGYGAGTTVLQLEGRLMDGGKESHATIADFAIREEHGGYPQGFFNPTVMSASYCLRYAAEQAIHRVASEIRDTIPAARPGVGDSSVASAGN